MLNSIRNVKFIKMRKLTMFITAVCVSFLARYKFLIIIITIIIIINRARRQGYTQGETLNE